LQLQQYRGGGKVHAVGPNQNVQWFTECPLLSSEP
jgi:hypothetical protein